MPNSNKAVAFQARARLQVIDGGREILATPTVQRSVFDRLRCGSKPYTVARELGVPVNAVFALVLEEAQARECRSYQRGWNDRGRLALFPLRAA